MLLLCLLVLFEEISEIDQVSFWGLEKLNVRSVSPFSEIDLLAGLDANCAHADELVPILSAEMGS